MNDTIGPYQVLRELGRGGMGEVWLARDTRLDRQVAIKSLPAHLATDPDRLGRFEREAKVLATLNHPNVGAIHGLEVVDGQRYLVLEYVEGETLVEHLARGPLPLDEAVPIAIQICDALSAAHEKNVIHRDLKPGNIMISAEGRTKVLDFGLARTADGSSSSISPGGMRDSPTVTSPAIIHSPTIPGAIMGTAGYMSPEQARGKPVDKRSDIFSFGCVLYEMLSGAGPFGGESVADSLGAILHKEPDLSRLPASTPPEVRRLLRRCLAKDRVHRLHDIADARLELEAAGTEVPQAIARGQKGSKRLVVLAILATCLAIIAAASLLWRRPATAAPSRPVVRFALTGIGMPIDAFQGIALSPDGRLLVYRTLGEDGREQLSVRSLDSLEATSLKGTELGWMPFFSPDGERVGFYSAGSLKSVTFASGMVRKIAMIDRGGYSGAVWMPDDSIIFAGSTNQFGRVRANGGEIESLEVKGLRDGEYVVSPSLLPGGEALLCGVSNGATFSIAVYDLKERSLKVISDNGFTPIYAPSGHVVYQQNQLMALPFDLKRRAATGPPFPVIADVGTRVSYQVRMFTLSADGTLAYIPRSALLDNGALMWVDRTGQSSTIVEVPRVIDTPRISHDGKRIAFRAPAPECNIWVHDLESSVTTRVTHEGDNHGLAWSPDDARLLFARLLVPQQWAVVATAVQGTGMVEKLCDPVIPRGFVSSVSPDSEYVLVDGGMESGGDDIYVVNTKDRSITPWLKMPYVERAASFSPDGRYVAYSSEESGRAEIYVQSFPDPTERRQVSAEGGTSPVWSRDGKELFFVSGWKMMSADVVTQSSFTSSRPRMLFESRLSARGASGLSAYDVSPDGQRFVMVRDRSPEGGAGINVVLNWLHEVKSLATTKAP